jgi:hypothetical protein
MRPPHRHPRCPGAHCRTLLQTVWDLGGGSNGTKSGAENVDVALDIAGQARVCRCAGFPTPLTPPPPPPPPRRGRAPPASGRKKPRQRPHTPQPVLQLLELWKGAPSTGDCSST